MKKILFVFDGEIESLPPFMSMLDVLVNEYKLTVLAPRPQKETMTHYESKGVKFECPPKQYRSKHRWINRVLRWTIFRLNFFIYAKKIFEQKNYDLVWIISAQTAIHLWRIIKREKYFITAYELHDRFPRCLRKLSKILKKAQRVFVCEENRAHIYRVWFSLSRTPEVIPNKPSYIPNPRDVKALLSPDITSIFKKEGRRILLYQGHITKDRNIDALCQALIKTNRWTLVLMGRKTQYLDELIQKYKFIRHLDFIPPPKHLLATSLADVGIVTYTHYSLNTIFCAPNKIWEYSAYGLPMLANKIPGLLQSVGKANAAICVDMDNPKEILKALDCIDKNYEDFRKNSLSFWNNVDIRDLILRPLKTYFQE